LDQHNGNWRASGGSEQTTSHDRGRGCSTAVVASPPLRQPPRSPPTSPLFLRRGRSAASPPLRQPPRSPPTSPLFLHRGRSSSSISLSKLPLPKVSLDRVSPSTPLPHALGLENGGRVDAGLGQRVTEEREEVDCGRGGAAPSPGDQREDDGLGGERHHRK
jgi:hypothetical protein